MNYKNNGDYEKYNGNFEKLISEKRFGKLLNSIVSSKVKEVSIKTEFESNHTLYKAEVSVEYKKWWKRKKVVLAEIRNNPILDAARTDALTRRVKNWTEETVVNEETLEEYRGNGREAAIMKVKNRAGELLNEYATTIKDKGINLVEIYAGEEFPVKLKY